MMMPFCHHCGEDIGAGESRETDDEENNYHSSCLKERESHNKCQLLSTIVPEEEEEFLIRTNDFSRPDLKQIGNSLFEIKCHFMRSDEFTIIPSKFESPLAEVKDALLQRLEDSGCIFHGENVVTRVQANHPGTHGTTRGFIFLSQSLPVAFNFTARHRPNSVQCDFFLQLPNQPAMVLTIVEGDKSRRDVIVYNTSVHRGITTTITRFLDVSFKTVFGVLNHEDIKDTCLFNACIETAVKSSSTFVSADSLSMNLAKYEKVLAAFWACVAETTSLTQKTKEENREFLHFLTKEQCIVLVENINSKEIHVTTRPSSGATTLMLEVARRLSRLDDTLLVVKKAEEVETLRSLHPDTVTADGLSPTKIVQYRNIVDETNTLKPRHDGRLWTFQIDKTVQKETETLKEKISELQKTNENSNERINELLREKEMLKRHLSYIQRENNLLDLKNRLNEATTETETLVELGERQCLEGARSMKVIQPEESTREGITKPQSRWERKSEPSQIHDLLVSSPLDLSETAVSYNQAISGVRLIRDFQQGQWRRSDIFDLLRDMMLNDHQNLKELRCQKNYLEEVVGCPVRTLGVGSKPVHVICSKLQFDKVRVNTEYCQITKQGILTNTPPEDKHQKPQRLRVYLGTITTTAFPPSPSSSDPLLHAPRYWESHNRIWLTRTLGKWLTVLEIGVSEESQVDQGVWVCNQSRSWAFRILGCNMHHPWICAQVYSGKQRLKCVRDIMVNDPGSSVRLKFGIVLDVGKGRIAFVDLNRMNIIHKFDMKFKEKLYPAFGVGPWRNEYQVDMTLVTGREIIWSDAKKDLIHKALN